MEANRNDKNVTSLFSDLIREISTLFRQEVGLVKTEISEKTDQAGSGMKSMVMGGAFMFAGLLILLIAAVEGLSLIMDTWLAGIMVAILAMIIGLSMVAKGKSDLKARNLLPRKSIRSIHRDKYVVQEHTQ